MDGHSPSPRSPRLRVSPFRSRTQSLRTQSRGERGVVSPRIGSGCTLPYLCAPRSPIHSKGDGQFAPPLCLRRNPNHRGKYNPYIPIGDAATTEIARQTDAQGFPPNRRAAVEGGTVAGNARRELETKSGRKVVTRENYLEAPESK